MIALPILLTLATVIVLFICFIKQPAPIELLALAAVGFLIATGLLKMEDFLTVFSNPAAMTVAAMFILSAALDKTGVIDALGKYALAVASKSYLLALGLILAIVFTGSFFINNTSIVLIMIPVMIALAHSQSLSASKLLLPLSYMSILGGTCTIIGTSTNLLVDGVGQQMGIPAFSMFEILVPGLAMAAVGGSYLLIVGRKLLPERKSLSEFFEQQFQKKYITQIHVSEKSGFAGKTLAEAGFTEEAGYQPVRIIRKAEEKDHGIRRFFSGSELVKIFREKIESKNFTTDIELESRLEVGDRLVLLTSQRQVLTHANEENEESVFEENDVAEDMTIVMEGIVAPDSSFVGKYVRQLKWGDNYDIHILAVHRQNGKISTDFEDVQLSVGDTLLLRGKESEIRTILENDELLNLSKPVMDPYNIKKAPIAIAAIFVSVTLAVLGVLPIAGSAFLAAVTVVLAGCLKTNDAYKALHAEVLLLIYAMLGISLAMEKTGAIHFIVNGIMTLVEDYPAFVIISVLYLITSCITEIFSNNAAAVMLTPIAVGLAQQLGVDPKAFAVAIMFGASASFATPIGYQTNTLVFNAGGYRFTDYLRIGLPMNIIMWIAASIIIPWYWGL